MVSGFSSRERRWLVGLLVAGGILRFFPLFLSDFFLALQKLPDDALYYFTIARNIAHGAGISFDGIHPTNGFHPLWQFILVPVYLLGLDGWIAIRAILALGSLLDLIVIWVLAQFAATVFSNPRSRFSAILFSAGVYALNPYAAFRGTNGLETTLAALLLLWSAKALFDLHSDAMPRRWVAAGTAIGLTLLARMDSVIVLAPLTAYLILLRSTRVAAVRALALAIVMNLPWSIWNLAEFGSLLPSSASAVPMFAYRKYEIMYGGLPWALMLRDAAANLAKPFAYLIYGLSLLPVTLAAREAFRRRSDPSARLYIHLLLLTIGGLLLLLFHSLVRTFIREWYVEFLLPIFALQFGIAVGLFLEQNRKLLRSVMLWLPAASLLLLGHMWYVLFMGVRFPNQGLLMKEVPTYLRTLAKPSTIGAFNSGYDGYFAPKGIRVVNLDGVVNERAIEALRERKLSEYLQKEKIKIIIDQMPDIIGYRNLFAPELLREFGVDSTIISADGSSRISILGRLDTLKGQ